MLMAAKSRETLTLDRPPDLCARRCRDQTREAKNEANQQADLHLYQLSDRVSRFLLTPLGRRSTSGQCDRRSSGYRRKDLQTL